MIDDHTVPAAASAVIDEHDDAGQRPGDGVAKAEDEQGVEPGEDREDPDNAQQADAQARDDHRPDRVAAVSYFPAA